MQAQQTKATDNLHFLQGGGEMGALIRSYNWAATPLGPPQRWPQSLRTTLSIIINSRFPMFLFWGPELICFYNDAYRPSLGNEGKHPEALGKPGADVWPEIWAIIKPLIDQVLAGGDATWSEDQLIPIYRNGSIEDVYWTFSYSPVSDETGHAAGVFVTCTETTRAVQTLQQLRISEQHFQNLIREASVGIAVLLGATFEVAVVNQAYGRLINRTPAELLNKPLFSIIPEAADPFEPLLRQVLETGEPLYFYNHPYFVFAGGERKEGFLNIVYEPYKDASGAITGVMALCQDVTAEVLARKKLQDSEARFRTMVDHSTVAMALTRGRAMTLQNINDPMLAIIDNDETVIGSPLLSVLPYLEGQSVLDILHQVFDTGIAYNGTEVPVYMRRGKALVLQYYNISYIPLFENGAVSDILHIAIDVTEQVQALKKIESSEQQVRSLVESAPFPIGVYVGREMRIQLANQTILDIWGKGNDVIGKLYSEILPELENQAIFQQLDEVYATGVPFHAKNQRVDIDINGKLESFYFNYSFTPLFDEAGKVYGVMNTAADVTDLAIAKQKVEESERFARSIFNNSVAAQAVWMGENMIITIANESMLDMWGRDASVIGKPFMEAMPELQGTPLLQRLRHVLHTGETYYNNEEKFDLVRYGKPYTGYYNYTYKALSTAANENYGVICTATEVTGQVVARKKIEESEQRFRLMADAMPQFVWTSDTEGNLNYYNQAVFRYSGLTYAQIEKEGWLQIVHPDEREENMKHWMEAIKTGHDFIFQHRLRNAEGAYRWQLSRAVAQRDGDGAIQMWIGTSTDIHDSKLFADELTRQVTERTAQLENKNKELEIINKELEQFAYIASHDLQEPIRKVSTFTQMLQKNLGDVDERSQNYLNKINQSAARMITLIRDVLHFSQLSKAQETFVAVNLTEVIENITADFELLIEQKEATVQYQNLPVVKAIPLQMTQLFSNLLSNALKFSRPDVKPVITITAKQVSGAALQAHLALPPNETYHQILFQDNGIGFNQENAEQIFGIFQRLHGRSEYAGTGIGLALCKKIAQNHGGNIIATGASGAGARFQILLPVRR